MKIKIVFLLTCLFFLPFEGNLSAQEKERKEKNTNKNWVEFVVDMHCMKCKKKIERNIGYEKGVTDLKVDFPTKLVSIEYRSDQTDENKLKASLEKLGYKVAFTVPDVIDSPTRIEEKSK